MGIHIKGFYDEWLKLLQLQLVQQILQDLGLCSHANNDHRYMPKTMQTPATSTVTLTRDLNRLVHNEKWNYCSVIGKLNFLEKLTRPKLAYAVHNAARFSANPRQSHSQVVKQIGWYLPGSQDKEIIMMANFGEGFISVCQCQFLWTV